MADTKYLKRRHETWFFTLAVPRELRAKVGKDHIVKTLKTRDLTVAQERRWAMLDKACKEFASLSGRVPAAEPVDHQSLAEMDEVARLTYHQTLGQMEADEYMRAWGKAELADRWSDLDMFYLVSDFAPVAQPLIAYGERKGVAPRSSIYMQLGHALLEAQLKAIQGRQDALEGRPTDEPTTFLQSRPIDPVTLQPFRIGATRGGLTFAEVASRFIAERQRDPAFALTEQTKGQYEAAFRLFDQWGRQPRLDDVDRRKASDFLDAISSLDPHWAEARASRT